MPRVHSSDDKLIDRTQKKLRKAQFFLGNLGHESRVPGNEHEAFDHYLSAFLSAARSVTFALQIEDKERYDRIFPKWQNNLANEERDMLKHMNEQRVAEVHNKGAKTTVEWEMVPMIEVRDTRNRPGNSIWGFHVYALPGTEPNKIGRQVHYFELGGTKVKVTETCNQYLDLLENLVREIVQAHEAGCHNDRPG